MTQHEGLICRRILWGGNPYRVLSASDGLDQQIIRGVERHVEHFLGFPSSSFIKYLKEKKTSWYYQVVGDNLRSLTKFFIQVTNRPEFQAHTIIFSEKEFSSLCQRSLTLALQSLGDSFPSSDRSEGVITIPSIARKQLPPLRDGTFEILSAILRGEQALALGLGMEILDALMLLLPDEISSRFVIAYGAASDVVESNLLIPCGGMVMDGEASLPLPRRRLREPEAWINRIQACIADSAGEIQVESLVQLQRLQPEIETYPGISENGVPQDQNAGTGSGSGTMSSIRDSLKRYWSSK